MYAATVISFHIWVLYLLFFVASVLKITSSVLDYKFIYTVDLFLRKFSTSRNYVTFSVKLLEKLLLSYIF